MTTPIAVQVTRYRCPFCPRSLSSKTRMVEHIGKCWNNPAARGCKTCRHFMPDESEPDVGYVEPEQCAADVGLSGGCAVCGLPPEPGQHHCPDPNHWLAEMTMPGPIIGCDLWEASDA